MPKSEKSSTSSPPSHPSPASSSPPSHPSPASSSSDDADNDVPMVPSAAALRDVVHDPHAVKLCASLLPLLEQLKKLAGGREQKVSRFAEEKPGADIYELSLDRARGSLSVTCLQETVEGLDAATTEARESLAHEIAQRKADIEGLEKEVAAVGTKIQESKGEGIDVLVKQLGSLHVMIGKHRETVAELEGRSEVKVKVMVKRVRTCVELLKTETSSEDPEVRMVPKRDAGIYVLGGKSKEGHDPSSALTTVERYDVKKDRWEAVASMNCKRWGLASAVLDGKVYAIGSEDEKVLSSVECFSPKSGCWDVVAPLTSARDGCAVGLLNGRLYVAGGTDGNSTLSSVTSFCAGASDQQDVAPMTYRRYCAAGAVLHGFFYVVGGELNGVEISRTVERYDPANNTWELVAPMNSKRTGCAAVACNGYLYALGGWDGTSCWSSVERFDPRLNSWEVVASMTCERYGVAAYVLDGRIYAMGGEDERDSLSSMERYDPASNRWELVAPMSAARMFHAAVVAT